MKIMSERYIIRCPGAVDDELKLTNEGFGESLWKSLERNSTATALVEVGGAGLSVTYDELLKKAELVASLLLSYGCKQRDVIAIFAPNSIDWIVVCLAAFRIGAVPVGINALVQTNELLHQVRICSAKFIFTENSHAQLAIDAAKQLKAKVLLMGNVDEKLKAVGCIDIGQQLNVGESLPRLPSFQSLHISLDQLAVIFFSSGTTGLQKGVMLSHRNLQYQFVSETCEKCHILSTVQIVFTQLAHLLAFNVTMFGLGLGFTTYLMKCLDVDEFLETVDKHLIENILIFPSLATAIVKNDENGKYNLRHVKDMMTGAASLGSEVEEILLKKFPHIKIRQGYGMTELSGPVVCVPYSLNGTGSRKPKSVGVPTPFVLIKVIDLISGDPLRPNLQGEICVKSPLVMKGYVQDSQLKTVDSYVDDDGWLHTRDLGYYDEDGYFFVVDRIVDLIHYQHQMVAPAELEAVLLSHSDVADAAVVGLPNLSSGELPLAWVVKKQNSNVTENELKRFVDGRLLDHQRLRGGVHFVPSLPKTYNGKLLRRKIREVVSLER